MAKEEISMGQEFFDYLFAIDDPTSLISRHIEASRFKQKWEQKMTKILEKTRKRNLSFVFITPIYMGRR